jgi:hypothetical protein
MAILLGMGTYERRPSQEPNKDEPERQQSTEKRPTTAVDDLLAWLSEMNREQGREEAFDLLLDKVKRGQLSRENLQLALRRAEGHDEATVIHVVMASLDRTSSPHGG